MNRIFTLFSCLIISTITFAQDFVANEITIPYTDVAPILDETKDFAYNNAASGSIERWINGVTPVDGMSAEFWVLYDEEKLYVYASVVDPTVHENDEVSFTIDISAERSSDIGWENNTNCKNGNGFLFTKLERRNGSITNRYANYSFINTTKGYDIEMNIAWTDITTDQAIIDAFKERKTFFFDIGVKNDKMDDQYFAWSNDDNTAWTNSLKCGEASLGAKSALKNMKQTQNLLQNQGNGIFRINNEYQISQVTVFNTNGQKVASFQLSPNQQTIDLSDFKNDIYILKCSSSTQAYTEKIIKQ